MSDAYTRSLENQLAELSKQKVKHKPFKLNTLVFYEPKASELTTGYRFAMGEVVKSEGTELTVRQHFPPLRDKSPFQIKGCDTFDIAELFRRLQYAQDEASSPDGVHYVSIDDFLTDEEKASAKLKPVKLLKPVK